jgi:enoyl-[acyl-carrier protein] reductase III
MDRHKGVVMAYRDMLAAVEGNGRKTMAVDSAPKLQPGGRRFEGKVALVTGGTKGIGRAVALKLADQGCNVVVNYFRSRDAAQRTVDELKERNVEAVAVRGNIGNPEFHSKLFDTIRNEFGELHVFVSNAALGAFAGVFDVTEKMWDLSMRTNAQAFLFCAQQAIRLMPAGGKIVALTSLGSHRVIPGYSAIGVSKAAIESLTKYLAMASACQQVNVNAVCGGFIDTDALKSFPNYEELLEEVLRRSPLDRVGTAEEVADVVVFLCSDGANWITGQTVVVDGGYSLT